MIRLEVDGVVKPQDPLHQRGAPTRPAASSGHPWSINPQAGLTLRTPNELTVAVDRLFEQSGELAEGSARSGSLPAAKNLSIVAERDVREQSKIVDAEERRIDNLLGTTPIRQDVEVSYSLTSELSLMKSREIDGSLSTALWKVLNIQAAAKLNQQTGVKAGETLTARETFHLEAGPHELVTYRIEWTLVERTGHFQIRLDNGPELLVPYVASNKLVGNIQTLSRTGRRSRK